MIIIDNNINNMQKEIISKYFDLPESKVEKINQLMNLYAFWNRKINLISRKDFDFFYERHVLHSLSICKVFSFKPNSKIMDLGTGGGFPGIPLAIMFPDVHFILVDSITKKTQVINVIIKDLGLDNVTVLNCRAEDIDDKFDFVISRAVAPLEKLIMWTKNQLSNVNMNNHKNGLICLKGGDLKKELQKNKKNITIFPISNFFNEDFFLEKKIIYWNK